MRQKPSLVHRIAVASEGHDLFGQHIPLLVACKADVVSFLFWKAQHCLQWRLGVMHMACPLLLAIAMHMILVMLTSLT